MPTRWWQETPANAAATLLHTAVAHYDKEDNGRAKRNHEKMNGNLKHMGGIRNHAPKWRLPNIRRVACKCTVIVPLRFTLIGQLLFLRTSEKQKHWCKQNTGRRRSCGGVAWAAQPKSDRCLTCMQSSDRVRCNGSERQRSRSTRRSKR